MSMREFPTSVILDGAELGEFVLLGAGSLVTPGTIIPAYSKALGRPAKVVAPLTEKEIEALRFSAGHYVRLMTDYAKA
jgi:carbonic anhydrase/acetyltransferase-like protein (isoleucine patch superfamily)